MPLTDAKATTGRTSPDAKDPPISYQVGTDIALTCDTTTIGHTVTLVVAAADEREFVKHLLGYAELDGTILHRVLPEPSPFAAFNDDTGKPTMFAVKVDPAWRTVGSGYNSQTGAPEFDLVAYRVQYAAPLYKVKEDGEVDHEHERFCVWREKVSFEAEKIPGASFKFVTAAKTPLNEVGVRTGRRLELTCKWLDVPNYGFDTLITYANKVNNAAITLNGVTYDAETVLVLGIEREPRINAAVQRTQDITFTLSVRADGRTWNKFWLPGTGHTLVTDNGDAGGTKPFEPADLNSLWMFS